MQSQRSSRRKGKNKLAIIAHTFPLVIFSCLKSLMSIDHYLLQQHLKILVQTTQHPSQDQKKANYDHK